jgi:hypothetical protein
MHRVGSPTKIPLSKAFIFLHATPQSLKDAFVKTYTCDFVSSHWPFTSTLLKLRRYLLIMDIVLEICDALVFDRIYAAAVPLSRSSSSFQILKNAAASAGNATLAGLSNLPPGYQYHPASQYIQIEPTRWAYLSAWPRDNIIRQTISLYLILW